MQSAQQKHYMTYIVLPQGWIPGLAGLARHLSYINSALPTLHVLIFQGTGVDLTLYRHLRRETEPNSIFSFAYID